MRHRDQHLMYFLLGKKVGLSNVIQDPLMAASVEAHAERNALVQVLVGRRQQVLTQKGETRLARLLSAFTEEYSRRQGPELVHRSVQELLLSVASDHSAGRVTSELIKRPDLLIALHQGFVQPMGDGITQEDVSSRGTIRRSTFFGLTDLGHREVEAIAEYEQTMRELEEETDDAGEHAAHVNNPATNDQEVAQLLEWVDLGTYTRGQIADHPAFPYVMRERLIHIEGGETNWQISRPGRAWIAAAHARLRESVYRRETRRARTRTSGRFNYSEMAERMQAGMDEARRHGRAVIESVQTRAVTHLAHLDLVMHAQRERDSRRVATATVQNKKGQLVKCSKKDAPPAVPKRRKMIIT